MITWIKKRVPERSRRLLARILLWTSAVLCMVISVQLVFNLHARKKYITFFTEYFNLQKATRELRTELADSVSDTTDKHLSSTILDGWSNTASWLEKLQKYGDSLGIIMEYSLDSLSAVPGGISSVKRLPVYFKIEANNNFAEVLSFLHFVSTGTTSIHIDSAEFTGGQSGLSDANITITAWIRL